MNKKKIGILLIALIAAVTISVAQPRGQRDFDPEEMAKRQTERLNEALDLNKDQKQKVYDLNLETGKKMRKLREEQGGNGFEAMRDEMGKIREEQNVKMKKILTDKQWTKYEKYLEERRERMRNGGWRNR